MTYKPAPKVPSLPIATPSVAHVVSMTDAGGLTTKITLGGLAAYIKTQATAAPLGITNFAAGAITSATVALTWVEPGSVPITRTVSQSNSGQNVFTPSQGNFNSTGGVVTNLAAGTTYDFRVLETNAAGISPTVTLTGITTANLSAPSATLSGVPATSFVNQPIAGSVIFAGISTVWASLFSSGGDLNPRTQVTLSGPLPSLIPLLQATYRIHIYTAAAAGALLASSADIVITAQGAGQSVALSNVTTAVLTGGNITGNVVLTGITSAFAVLFFNGAEEGSRTAFSGNTLPTLHPQNAGDYTVRVFLAAQGGTVMAESADIVVTLSSAPSVTFSGISNPVTLGAPITGTVTYLNVTPIYMVLFSNGVEDGARLVDPPATNNPSAILSGLPTSLSLGQNINGTVDYLNIGAVYVCAFSNGVEDGVRQQAGTAPVASAALSGIPSSINVGQSVAGTVTLNNINPAFVVLYSNGADEGNRTAVTGT